MNTRISYLYRDADNYKMLNECVVQGEITDEMQATILSCLDSGEYFIPRAVGLPEERFNKWTDADHWWFELDEYGFETTDAPSTVGISAEELVSAFERCAGRWESVALDGFYAAEPVGRKALGSQIAAAEAQKAPVSETKAKNEQIR